MMRFECCQDSFSNIDKYVNQKIFPTETRFCFDGKSKAVKETHEKNKEEESVHRIERNFFDKNFWQVIKKEIL